MRLNSLKSSPGARPAAKRVGRGIGSGFGKTSGRGHKGQKSRSGGFHKVGFEGGQMPLQRRLPKRGFASRKSMFTAEVGLHELSKLAGDVFTGDVFTLEALKSAGVVNARVRRVKIIKSGSIDKAVSLQGLPVTPGARAAIEAAGGKIES